MSLILNEPPKALRGEAPIGLYSIKDYDFVRPSLSKILLRQVVDAE